MRQFGDRFFDEDSPQLDRFGPLLLLTAVTVAALSLIDLNSTSENVVPEVASTLLGVVVGITLILALRAAGVARRWRLAAEIFVGLAVVIGLILLAVDLATDSDAAIASGGPSPLSVLIAVATPAAVIGRLVRHRRVRIGTIYGAVAGYLLIAIAFAYLFRFVDMVQDESFFTTDPDPSTTSFMYFSLVSITTVGYGTRRSAHPAPPRPTRVRNRSPHPRRMVSRDGGSRPWGGQGGRR